MLLVTLIKYFLHWSNKKCNIFSAAGSIENFAFCPSRYIDIILYADEGSVLDPPPALPVSTLYVLSEMHSRAGKKVASGKPCLRLCLTWYLENYMLCKCEKMIFHHFHKLHIRQALTRIYLSVLFVIFSLHQLQLLKQTEFYGWETGF